MAANAEQPWERPKAKIFISYSRKDMVFADRIDAALKGRGFEPLIDRTEIYAFEEWWERLQALIRRCDTVVFVLSPDAVASREAQREVEYAASLNKRFAPIVCRPTEDSAVPQALRRLNFIFFDNPERFETQADQLAEALLTDIGWIRQHTEFGEMARRWSDLGGPGGLLLRSPALEQAERWISSRPHGAPEPTAATQTFVVESRRGATRRRNILTCSLAAGLVVAIALAGFAYRQRGLAVEQRDEAQRQRITTLAELVTNEQLIGNADTALRIGVYAARLAFALDLRESSISAPQAALAAAVSQTNFRLAVNASGDLLSSAAFSLDGTRIVTASRDKTARIWDAATGAELLVLRGHTVWVHSAAFSPDGTRVVTSSLDKTARVWDAITGKQIVVFDGHQENVYAAAFSPDGRRVVTASMDHTARIWDATSGKSIAILMHPDSVDSAAFSSDGMRIVTVCYDKTIRIWDATTANALKVLNLPDDAKSAVFSPDRTRIVITLGNTARILDAGSGTELAIMREHKNWVASAVFSPDGTRVVTAASDGTARIFDAISGAEIAVLRGHEDIVNSAAFSADGRRIVTASGSIHTDRSFAPDNTARIWDAATGTEITVLRGHEGGVNSAVFSPDGAHVVTASKDYTARVWGAGSGKDILQLREHAEDLTPHYANVLCPRDDPIASIFCASDNAQSKQRGSINSAAYSLDGTRIVTASGALASLKLFETPDNTARIWDATTGKELMVLRGHAGRVTSAAFSPDGTRVVTASGGGLILGPVGGDGTARIWNSVTGKQIAILDAGGPFTTASYSRDGKRIVTATNGTPLLAKSDFATIWDATSAAKVIDLQGPGQEYSIVSAVFSPDGTRVLTASIDHTARIWNAEDGREILVIRGHDGLVNSAAFSTDGRRIVTASSDKTARVWDAATGNQIALLEGHDDVVNSAAFSPDGNRVITASEDKTARIWNVRFATMSTDDLVREVCTRRLRGLTKLTSDEMRLAGYTGDATPIDVCAGVR
jgi:WD40 repeat protein